MKNYIVFDIGGSSVKYAIITDEGEFVSKGSYKSEKMILNYSKYL